MKSRTTLTTIILVGLSLGNVATGALPDPGVSIVPGRTASIQSANAA